MSCFECGAVVALAEDGSVLNSVGGEPFCDDCIRDWVDQNTELDTEPLSVVTATADASKFPPMAAGERSSRRGVAEFPPLAGWYPSPAGEPIPWHFDGNRWSHPAEKFDTMIEALFSDEDMTALMRKMVVEKRPMVQRKIFYAKVKYFFKDLTQNVMRGSI